MKNKPILGLIILTILSTFVFASDNAPPALPMEIWGEATLNGNPAANGLAIVAEVGGVDYTQESPVTFNDGYYNIMLVDGDRELTYIDDPDCTAHDAADEACIPCSTDPGNEDYCIEGPEDDDKISIKISAIGVMPFLSWFTGSSEEVDIVTPIGDWSEDGCVDMGDFVGPFADYYGPCPCVNPVPLCRIYDLNLDCQVDMGDFVGSFADHYNEGCGG